MAPTALLIGGSGQLGSELVKMGEGRWRFVAPSHRELDVADADALKRTFDQIRPELVINCSAFHVVDLCESRFLEALTINTVAVSVIARLAEAARARFVTVSSDYVFDGGKRSPYLETDATGPIQNYGISKAAGELAARAAHPHGTLVIRSCGLYGLASSRQKSGNFVLNRLKDARTRSEIEVGSDLVCTPTYTADLAGGILALIDNMAPPGIYHLTNSGSCNWAEFTAEILRVARADTRTIPIDRGGRYAPARRPSYSVLDCTKAEQFGVRLPSWQDAIARYLATLPA